MAKGSRNKTVTISLIQTFQKEIKPEKLYDCLQRMDDDLNKTYETLFEGPLPAVSGENLLLQNTPELNFPTTTMFTDKANVVTESPQSITKDFSEYRGSVKDGQKLWHIQAVSDGEVIWSNGLAYDPDTGSLGADSGDGVLIEMKDAAFEIWQSIASVISKPFKIAADLGTFIWGEPKSLVDGTLTPANANDMIIANGVTLRACRKSAPFATLPVMTFMDLNDLVDIGSNPTGSTSGEGNISIPTAVAADLPLAGATRNGILILDKTNNRLCYYVGGLRYKIALGTAF